MTGPDDRPQGPDGSELSQEEWDAVRRLRDRQARETAHETVRETVRETEPAAPVEPTASVAEAERAEPAEHIETAEHSEPVVDVQPVADTAPPAGAPAPPRRRTGPTRSLGVVAVTGLVVIALLSAVVATLVAARLSHRHAVQSAGTDAVSAATSGVATVLSYNYRSLEADFAKAEALLTPGFRKTYDATTAKAVQPLAAKYKAVSTAQVTASGVVDGSTSKATVLVFVSQQVTNTQLSAPRLDRSRIIVELVHQRGHWLINKLTPV